MNKSNLVENHSIICFFVDLLHNPLGICAGDQLNEHPLTGHSLPFTFTVCLLALAR